MFENIFSRIKNGIPAKEDALLKEHELQPDLEKSVENKPDFTAETLIQHYRDRGESEEFIMEVLNGTRTAEGRLLHPVDETLPLHR